MFVVVGTKIFYEFSSSDEVFHTPFEIVRRCSPFDALSQVESKLKTHNWTRISSMQPCVITSYRLMIVKRLLQSFRTICRAAVMLTPTFCHEPANEYEIVIELCNDLLCSALNQWPSKTTKSREWTQNINDEFRKRAQFMVATNYELFPSIFRR